MRDDSLFQNRSFPLGQKLNGGRILGDRWPFRFQSSVLLTPPVVHIYRAISLELLCSCGITYSISY
jgi:hypothetical protein